MLKKTVNKNKKRKIVFNSQNIKKGDIFIPYGGLNRSKYIDEALDKKCHLVITDTNYSHPKVLKVKNLNREVISILNNYYDYPLKDITLIGITGTDGKTTMASILSDLLNCPSLGTNGFFLLDKTISLPNTTPSIDILYECFQQVRENKFNNLVMEVSSEAYLTNRIGNLLFDIAIFTNITKEHLDKHSDFTNYLNCKLQLFRHSKVAILNRDSKYYYTFKDNSRLSYSYGFKKGSDLQILFYKLFFDSSLICFKYQGKKYKVIYPLLGKFNVYNIAACILTLLKLNYKIDDIILRFKNIKPVKGRMEIMKTKNPMIVIDYAHTVNSTLNVLKFFSKYTKNIITIVGCAGDRYKEKRKEIGYLVLKYSKFVIFTSDDPRYEDPNDIIDQMIDYSKKKNYLRIIDRKKAILYALESFSDNYLILILGKGRDKYMLICDQKINYSDYETITKYLKSISK